MSKPPKLSLASIVASAVPPTNRPGGEVIQLTPAKPQESHQRGTLKERAKQLSVYLEPPVYDQLRDIAYTERTKIHQLMLEALDLLFQKRGALSINQLNQPR
jgi:hypothetical protein